MSGKQQEPEAMWTLFLIVVLLVLGFAIFWHYFQGPILEVMRWIRFGELWIVNLVTGGEHRACLDWLRLSRVGDTNPSGNVITATNNCFGSDYLAAMSSEDQMKYFALSGTSMMAIESMVTPYIRWIFVALFAFMAFYVVYMSPRNKFRVKHNLESFIKTQAKMWPVISPIVNFNPIKSSARMPGGMVPDKLPLFAEALSPEEWLSWHRIPVTNGIPDREMTRRALMLQLGPRWNGLDGLPAYIRALMATFALKGVQKRDESDDLLGRISLCWSDKSGLKLSAEVNAEIEKVLSDKDMSGKLLEAAAPFAYRTTAILGALRWARLMGGVLAPAQFLWLRGVDRNLWYALNNLGRRSFHSEGAGALAHFMAEQNAHKALPIPRIDTAIVTINQHLAERGQPIPPREGDAKAGS